MKDLIEFKNRFLKMFNVCQVTAVSAGLSFYITLTFFPMMVCLYTFLGNSVDKLRASLNFLSSFVASETVELIRDFIDYISENNKPAMLIAGVILLMTFASAAVRQFQNYIGTMQGGNRFKGIPFFLFSMLFALIFIAVVYFSMIVLLSGSSILNFIDKNLPFIYVPIGWSSIRFPLIGLIFFVLCQIMYSVSKRSTDDYPTLFGSLAATVCFDAVTIFCSAIINKSVRYPLVYGSLASVVLLMLWLYYVCYSICCGALINIVIRDMRMEKIREEYDID